MNPATLLTPKQTRKQVGPAVWIVSLLAHLAPAEWKSQSAAWVANGNVTSDADLARYLQVKGGGYGRDF